MRVEDKWEDYSVWRVGFKSVTKETIVHKCLVLESEYCDKDIAEFVFSNFSKVLSVEYVDLLMDQCMKPNQKSYNDFGLSKNVQQI